MLEMLFEPLVLQGHEVGHKGRNQCQGDSRIQVIRRRSQDMRIRQHAQFVGEEDEQEHRQQDRNDLAVFRPQRFLELIEQCFDDDFHGVLKS